MVSPMHLPNRLPSAQCSRLKMMFALWQRQATSRCSACVHWAILLHRPMTSHLTRLNEYAPSFFSSRSGIAASLCSCRVLAAPWPVLASQVSPLHSVWSEHRFQGCEDATAWLGRVGLASWSTRNPDPGYGWRRHPWPAFDPNSQSHSTTHSARAMAVVRLGLRHKHGSDPSPCNRCAPQASGGAFPW
jgi:hypothetical protein